jgi:hypothetical protein
LYAGDRAGLPAAVLAFEPRRSDLPLQVAFPILMANLVGELLGGSGSPADAVAPGSPVTLAIPSGATGLAVERPDGSVDELLPGAEGAATVIFSRTDLLGVYTVRPLGLVAPSPSPAGSGSASPAASPSGTPAASPSPTEAPPVDPSEPVRFAVDLFDVDESTIAPGSAATLEALGTPRGTGPGAVPADRPDARDELWLPILLVVLVLLLVEWLVYERDALARLRRGIGGRLGRTRPAGTD